MVATCSLRAFSLRTIVVTCALLVGGCDTAVQRPAGNTDLAVGGQNRDLASAGGQGDLGVAPSTDQGTADLAPAGPLTGCTGLSACENNCNDPACSMKCQSLATPNALALYNTATQCGEDWCIAAHHCMYDAMMNPVDPTGMPAGTCDNCLNDATAMLTAPPSMCNTPGGPDCNPSMCVPAQMACLADKP